MQNQPVDHAPEARMSRRAAGVLATSVAVTLWGLTSVLVKVIDEFDSVGISFHRLLMGGVLLSAVFVARGGRFSRTMLVTCIPGGLAFGADIVMFFSALRETSVANATVIGALQPIVLLPIGVRWFGDRTDRTGITFSVIAVAGTAAVVFGNTAAPEWSPTGDLLAVGALASWCLYFLATRQARRTLGGLEFFTGVTVVSVIVIVPYALVVGADLSSGRAFDWVAVFGMTALSGAVGHVLLSWAQGHVPLQIASVLTLLVPVVATVSAAVFLDEAVNAVQVLGMAVVVVALVMVVRHSHGGRPEAVPAEAEVSVSSP